MTRPNQGLFSLALGGRGERDPGNEVEKYGSTALDTRRVPSRFFGIRDLAYLKTRIRDFRGKGKRDSGL